MHLHARTHARTHPKGRGGGAKCRSQDVSEDENGKRRHSTGHRNKLVRPMDIKGWRARTHTRTHTHPDKAGEILRVTVRTVH